MENSHLIEIEELEPAFDGKWFNGKVGEWAKIGDNQIDQAASYLRGLFDKSIPSKGTGAVQRAKEFTWAESAKKLVEVIKCI